LGAWVLLADLDDSFVKSGFYGGFINYCAKKKTRKSVRVRGVVEIEVKIDQGDSVGDTST
jgi:hypothetical protein